MNIVSGAHMRPWSEESAGLAASPHYPSSWTYPSLWVGQNGYPAPSAMDPAHMPMPPHGFQIARHPVTAQLILVPTAGLGKIFVDTVYIPLGLNFLLASCLNVPHYHVK